MRQTDIVIAGAGLAGSTAAAMLSRAGYDVLLVDPHTTYPPDFRCEKLDRSQIEILKKTGLADVVLKVATPEALSATPPPPAAMVIGCVEGVIVK